MPLPTSLGLHIEHYYDRSAYVIITSFTDTRCTMLEELDDWEANVFNVNALSKYIYDLVDPSILTLDQLRLHYPEILV